MATNILGHADRRRYNPARDIAYCWPNLMRSTMGRISKEQGCSLFTELANKYVVADEALIKVAECTAKYMQLCNDPENNPTTVLEAMEKSGLLTCENNARMLMYAALGETMMAAFHSAIRDVLVEGEESPLNDKRLSVEVDKSIMAVVKSRNRSLLSKAISYVRSYFTDKA